MWWKTNLIIMPVRHCHVLALLGTLAVANAFIAQPMILLERPTRFRLGAGVARITNPQPPPVQESSPSPRELLHFRFPRIGLGQLLFSTLLAAAPVPTFALHVDPALLTKIPGGDGLTTVAVTIASYLFLMALLTARDDR